MKTLILLASLMFCLPVWSQPAAPECSDQTLQLLYENAEGEVHLECSLVMRPDSVIRKRVLVEGKKASNASIDCAGSRLERGMRIYSRKTTQSDGSVAWDTPTNVRVSNCVTEAITHVFGMAINGEGSELTASSREPGHTERVQTNAPSNIHFDQFTTETNGPIPFYFGPGVTHSSITNSRITGFSNSVAIYLDAESGHNLIEGNIFSIERGRRELVAVDGSANNRIINNRFNSLREGGIYLYRNCGEGGNIRHQPPENNLIEGNRFFYDKYTGRNPGIWLGSRDGNRNYCDYDEGYDLGSSADDGDFANNNRVINNTFVKFQRIRDDGEGNLIENNRLENPGQCFLIFCW